MKQLYVYCLFCFIAIGIASAEEWMPDPGLRQAVRDALGLSDESPLVPAAMLQLTKLDAGNRHITELTGLEYASNVTQLNFGENQIRNLAPLAGLGQLEELWLFVNPLSDISPLANLRHLKTLDLGACHISDIGPLATLRNLERLRLHHNQVQDITALAHLTRLSELWLHHNQIADVQPLANLTRLTALRLNNNRIVDITPLANVTLLEDLSLHANAITDFTPIKALALTHVEHDEICEGDRLPIHERIQNRSFPSVFLAWGELLNRPTLSPEAQVGLHDLYWFCCAPFGMQWINTAQGVQLVGNVKKAKQERDALLAQNPNLLFLAELRMRDAFPDNHYHEKWPYWLRDAAGNKVAAATDYAAFLIDFTYPDVQDIIVQQAVAVAKCGLSDGIFLDWWKENHAVLADDRTGWREGYRGFDAEQRARLAIIERIRNAVGDDFLIVVNTNRSRIPKTAPYINGTFMETLRDNDEGYTHEGLIEIESTLLWAEEHLRAPQINSLEGWGIPTEPPDSPKNQQWMRVFTTMSLTHSDGYVLYIIGIRTPNHEHDWAVFEVTHKIAHEQGKVHNHHHAHYWYDFWDAALGKPIGPKAQRYENRPGLFIREFTNGWAAYNRSGKPQVIHFPEPAAGVESGLRNTRHLLPDLDGEIYLKSD